MGHNSIISMQGAFESQFQRRYQHLGHQSGHPLHGYVRRGFLFNGDLSNWDTSSANWLQYMFSGATDFTGQGIGDWNMGNAVDISAMFRGTEVFNVDLSKWDTSHVTKMEYTFANTAAFNQKLGAWDTSQVTTMNGMFTNAEAFNQDIGDWEHQRRQQHERDLQRHRRLQPRP